MSCECQALACDHLGANVILCGSRDAIWGSCDIYQLFFPCSECAVSDEPRTQLHRFPKAKVSKDIKITDIYTRYQINNSNVSDNQCTYCTMPYVTIYL